MRERPLLIYDGDCGFCKFWIERWRHLTGDSVDYAPYQEVGDQFPQIPKEHFEKLVQLIQPGTNEVLSGAHAVFRSLACNRRYQWLLNAYRKIPAFRFLSEKFYELVAQNRVFFSKLTHFFYGRSPEPFTYFIAQRIFLAALGLTYLTAFVSLGVQVTGLYGTNGILPISDYLQTAETVLGPRSHSLFPTLLWFNSSDFFLQGMCWSGALLSFGLILGIASLPAAALLWFLYLSFVTVGQEFLSFQWDVLLLEVGFLAIFMAPLKWKLKSERPAPSFIFVLLMRWLLFRLLFSSGLVKLASGDPAWRNWTALLYHYETQPLPTWIGWYVHQLPVWFHQFSVGAIFLMELVVPFFIFFPRRLRLFAAAAISVFQILIGLTGNYCFFNFLTVALCLWLVDDQTWKGLQKILLLRGRGNDITDRRGEPMCSPQGRHMGLPLQLFACFAALIIFSLNFVNIPPLEPFHLVNRYGLFAVMTTERPEIIVEGSSDGVAWQPYEFRYKAGDPKKKPAFAQPHQPRLDWQMWFAALSDYRYNRWFLKFCERLLEGSPEVLALLKHNPFREHPPKYIRAVVYDYRFSNLSQKRREQIWWVREKKGMYCPVLENK